MVLMKRVDERGFCFFTNAGSEKGIQLQENPRAAMCFHWKSLRRQVRVEGTISEMETAEVDAYFHSRSRKSQIGAAVSEQSRPLARREILEEKVRKFSEAHPDEVPRPPYWKGYCLYAERIEFWMDGPDRLHDPFVSLMKDKGRERSFWISTAALSGSSRSDPATVTYGLKPVPFKDHRFGKVVLVKGTGFSPYIEQTNHGL
jgi:pyridoxamine 5'-phosphate oxidase